jgi:hypothetical protein
MIYTNLNFHYISGSFCVNLSFSDLILWLLRIILLNEPIVFLHFCDNLPFEEDLTLDLHNLKFLLPEDDLHQVSLNWLAGSGGEDDFFF